MKRTILIIGSAVFFMGCFVAGYLISGCSGRSAAARYVIAIHNPSKNEVDVNMTLAPSGVLLQHLVLRDPVSEEGARIKNLRIMRKGKTLASWQTVPGIRDLRTVWTGISKTPVEIVYKVTPLAKKDNVHGKMIGFIHNDYGYIRGMNVLYTPVSVKELLNLVKRQTANGRSPQAKIIFKVPPGFYVNYPGGGKKQMSFEALRNTYFGLGKLRIHKENVKGSGLSVAVYNGFDNGVREKYLRLIATQYENIARITHFTLTRAERTVTILPHDWTFGGAAGKDCIISEDSDETVVHEMFHWWNGEAVAIANDANWVKEGFTTYYTAKILFKSKVWSRENFDYYLGHLKQELQRDCFGKPADLVKASERLITGKGNDVDYTLVYNGGAMVAYELDRKLAGEGRTLDRVWNELYRMKRPVSTQIFLEKLAVLYGRDDAADCRKWVYGLKSIE